MKNQDFLDKLDAFVQELQEARSRAGDAAGATEYTMNRTEDVRQEVYIAMSTLKKVISEINAVQTVAQEAMAAVEKTMDTVEASIREADIAAAEAQNFSRRVESDAIAAAATAQKLAEAARKTITADPNVQNDIGK